MILCGDRHKTDRVTTSNSV
uniref:Uncharacterized protein n=1 Tax=Arundo donax TaxID=35708 RepID=A0A0A9EBM2_ARUDO